MVRNKSVGDRAFVIINTVLLSLLGIVFFYPMLYQLAISFSNSQAVAAKAKRPVSAGSVAEKEPEQPLACGCPGSHSRILMPRDNKPAASRSFLEGGALSQWPVQLKLAPVNAPPT